MKLILNVGQSVFYVEDAISAAAVIQILRKAVECERYYKEGGYRYKPKEDNDRYDMSIEIIPDSRFHPLQEEPIKATEPLATSVDQPAADSLSPATGL